jgi:predicted transposase YbfD/YdcC
MVRVERNRFISELIPMPKTKITSIKIQDYFQNLTDPRKGKITHPLLNIVVISVCAVICGADDFVAITTFAKKKIKWFETFLDMSAGVPSHDRFNAILAAIKPAEFEKCLLKWITALHKITGGQIVAIDGKTLRLSYDKASSKSAIHMVSAWATLNHISLGQVVTDAKSNEITAIPKLLKMLELKGALVTIDAMGCQTKIAKDIVDAGADYCLAVKGNQPTLHRGIIAFFDDHMQDNFARKKVRREVTHEKKHDGEVTREYLICSVPKNLPDRSRWSNLKAIGMSINTTIRDGKTTIEIRYYILNKYLSAVRFGIAVRSHWGIENSLHWQLDVTFQEDKCRIRKGHADTNFSSLRRTALSLLKNESTAKVGIKNKRLAAGWDEDYLTKVLLG